MRLTHHWTVKLGRHIVEAQLTRACNDIDLRFAGDVDQWLAQRWNELNESDPIVNIDKIYGSNIPTERLLDVPVDLNKISYVDGVIEWGDVNNRPESFRNIVNGVIEGNRESNFDEWFYRMQSIHLIEIPGTYGPIYSVGNSRHRVHTLKALGVETFSAKVSGQRMAEVIDLTYHFGHPNSMKSHLPNVLDALINTGYLNDLGDRKYEVVSELPGSWMIADDLHSIFIAANRYKKSYPIYGQSELEKATLSLESLKDFVEGNSKSKLPKPSIIERVIRKGLPSYYR